MASNDARIEISQNNAQMKYQAEVQAADNKAERRTNREELFGLALDQMQAVTETVVEENSSENVRNYQLALQEAIMSGKFEYKNMNPEDGLAESWEDYWGNYQSFTDDWLSEKSNLKGGFLSRASTKRAVNNYLSNSMTDIADSRKTQLWEQKVETLQNIQNSLLTNAYDETEYTSNFASLLSSDLFANKGITSMEGLARVTDYGINQYYEIYANEKALDNAGQPSNYYEAALNLQTAMRAYVGGWGQDYFKNYMASSEKKEGTQRYNLINAVHARTSALEEGMIELCDSSGGSSDQLQAFLELNKIGSFIEGQNGQLIRTDGLTDEEIEAANAQFEQEMTAAWTQRAAKNAELFTDFYADMALDMDGNNAPIFYSVDDIINYKHGKSDKEYSMLSDDYIKYQVKKNTSLTSMMKENTIKKSNLDAINTLGTAQENWDTLTAEEQAKKEEDLKEAYNTLWQNNYWNYAKDYFKFGSSFLVSDDTGSWNNMYTEAIFNYMEANNVDFVTAAINSGWYDTFMSNPDLVDESKIQLWEQQITTLQNIQNSLLTSVYDQTEYDSQVSTLLGNDKFVSNGISSMDGLAEVTDYGLNEYYETYEKEKALYEVGEPSNYYEAALNLQIAMRAYVGDWNKDYFKNYMASTNKAEASQKYNLIQAVHAKSSSLEKEMNALCDSSGGSSDQLQEFLKQNKIGSFVEGQNGQLIRVDGLTDAEIETANSQLEQEVTAAWAKRTAQNAETYNQLTTDLSQDIAGKDGPILYSVDDIIKYKDEHPDKYAGLSDEYIKYQVKSNTTLNSLMQENAAKKSVLDAINTLGTAQENWDTLTAEEKRQKEVELQDARNTLWQSNYWPFVSEYFNFGSSSLVTDDTGSWNNMQTGAIFDYMKDHDVDFATAAINSGWYDTYMGKTTIAGTSTETGDFSTAWTVDAGRFMENYAEKAYSVFSNVDTIINGAFTDAETADWSDEKKFREAAKLNGIDVSLSEQGFNSLITAYKQAVGMVSVGGVPIDDDTTIKAVFLNKLIGLNPNKTTAEKTAATESTIAWTKSLTYTLYEEPIDIGYMLVNSSNDGTGKYNTDAVVLAVQSKVSGALSSIMSSGTKEDAAAYCLSCGDTELREKILNAEDWKSVIDSSFIRSLTETYCTTSRNFYNAYADKNTADLSKTDFMTSTGTTMTIAETIENNCKDVYAKAGEAYLRMQYITNPAATYGKDYNGVSVAGTSIVADGSIGSEMFKTACAEVAYSTSVTDTQMALDRYSGYLTEDAMKALKETDSLNLALQSLGLFGDSTLQNILVKQFGPSRFGTLQSDDEYTEFAAYLSTNTEFLAQTKKAKERLDAGESEATVMDDMLKYIQDCVTDYTTWSYSEKVAATEKEKNKEVGVDFTVIGSLSEYTEKKDDKKADTAHDFFKNLNDNNSKLASQYFAGDLTTRSYINSMFISGDLQANETQASNYNLAVEIAMGNVAKTDKNAITLLCGVLAYNQIRGSNYQLDATKLTSDNIKTYEETVMSYLSSDLSATQQYDWERLQSSINLIVNNVAKYGNYGFEDTLSYATRSDGSTGYISDKSNYIQMNSDGTISMKLPDSMGGEVISDVSLYADSANTNDIATSLFDSDSVMRSYTGWNPTFKLAMQNTLVYSFESDGGFNTVKKYNETKEYLEGVNSTDGILIATPNGSNGSYSLELLTPARVNAKYNEYVDNGEEEKADNLLSQLTDTQAKTIKDARAAEDKAKAEAVEEMPTSYDSAQQYAQNHPKMGVTDLNNVLDSIDNENRFEGVVQAFKDEADNSNFMREKLGDNASTTIEAYADEIRKKNGWGQYATTDQTNETPKISSYNEAQQYAKDNPNMEAQDLYDILENIDNENRFNGVVQAFEEEAKNSDFMHNSLGDNAETTIRDWAETIRKQKGWDPYGNTSEEKITVPQAITNTVKKYKGKKFTNDDIVRMLTAHYDIINEYAVSLKQAIADGTLDYEGLGDLKSYYKDVDAYIDTMKNKVEKEKQGK